MPEHIHDKGYKRLLSQKRNFLHFMQKYIQTAWIKNIAEDDLTLIDKAFVDESFKEMESDLIYKVRNGDQEVIFYVLLELQSKCDYTMPFRLLVYMVELLKRLFYDTPKNIRERKDFRLPAVIPIVLYNGKQPWTAAATYREYTNQSDQFQDCVIDYRYLIVDLMRMNGENILETDSPLDNIFYLEKNSCDDNDLISAIQRIMKRAPMRSQEDNKQIYTWFIDRLREMVNNPTALVEIQEHLSKGDVQQMTYALDRLFDEKYQEARQETLIEVVTNMLKEGVEPRLIERITGVPLEEILELKNQNK